jgi:tripartite-type tricarboxylate transporter receptor subunit TctC
MLRTTAKLGAALGAVALSLAVASAPAQTPAEFYKGKTVTMIVGSGAGGGYDTYTRVLVRHFARHIPGQPSIVIQNMPGASGLTAINHVANKAVRDGTLISDAYSTMPLYPLLDGTNAMFDSFQLQWLGSISRATSVCIAWHTTPFKTLDDASAKTMRLSSTGATGWRVILPRMYNIVGKTKFDVIMGYDTGGDYLAIEKGEVDGSCTTYDTLMATQQNWISEKKITFIGQFGLAPLPALAGVQMGLDRVKDPADRAATELVLSQQETGRPYMVPPGVPVDRVKALRDAFAATMKDPEFLAETKKANLMVDPLTGAEMDVLLKKMYAMPKPTVDHAKKILEQASAAK